MKTVEIQVGENSLLSAEELQSYGAIELKAGKDVQYLKSFGWHPYVENADQPITVPITINPRTVKACVTGDPNSCVFAKQIKKMPGIHDVLVMTTTTYVMFADGRQVKYMNPEALVSAIREYDGKGTPVGFRSGDYTLRAPRERERVGTQIHHGKTTKRTLVIVDPAGEKWEEVFKAGGHREAFQKARKKYPQTEGYAIVKHQMKSSKGEFVLTARGGNQQRFDPVVKAMDIDNPANAEAVHKACEAVARAKMAELVPAKARVRVETVPRLRAAVR